MRREEMPPIDGAAMQKSLGTIKADLGLSEANASATPNGEESGKHNGAGAVSAGTQAGTGIGKKEGGGADTMTSDPNASSTPEGQSPPKEAVSSNQVSNGIGKHETPSLTDESQKAAKDDDGATGGTEDYDYFCPIHNLFVKGNICPGNGKPHKLDERFMIDTDLGKKPVAAAKSVDADTIRKIIDTGDRRGLLDLIKSEVSAPMVVHGPVSGGVRGKGQELRKGMSVENAAKVIKEMQESRSAIWKEDDKKRIETDKKCAEIREKEDAARKVLQEKAKEMEKEFKTLFVELFRKVDGMRDKLSIGILANVYKSLAELQMAVNNICLRMKWGDFENTLVSDMAKSLTIIEDFSKALDAEANAPTVTERKVLKMVKQK